MNPFSREAPAPKAPVVVEELDEMDHALNSWCGDVLATNDEPRGYTSHVYEAMRSQGDMEGAGHVVSTNVLGEMITIPKKTVAITTSGNKRRMLQSLILAEMAKDVPYLREISEAELLTHIEARGPLKALQKLVARGTGPKDKNSGLKKLMGGDDV